MGATQSKSKVYSHLYPPAMDVDWNSVYHQTKQGLLVPLIHGQEGEKEGFIECPICFLVSRIPLY